MKRLRVLVVGSGGREHALGWSLARSPSVARVESAPGNPGLGALGPRWSVAQNDVDSLVRLASEERFDLVVIGPEEPLALGLADRLRDAGRPVFGPGAAGAALEASKAFAKEFMQRHDIPTAPFQIVRSMPEAEALLSKHPVPVVVKASGLAAGKGVIVASSAEEARAACRACLEAESFGEAGRTVILEEKLEGEEASLFAITDGQAVHILPGAQDHKRALDGDRGPNTGGMGAYSPAPVLTPSRLSEIETRIVQPTLSGLRDERISFRGLLYFGIMLTEEGPQLLEYNVRFGDPETQAILPRLGCLDIGELLLEVARGELRSAPLPPPDVAAAACVVATAKDYPRSGSRGAPIQGLASAEAEGALIFHAGTTEESGRLVTAGGRILDVVGTGDTLQEAVERAYAGLGRIHFEGMRFRRDIAHRAFDRAR